MTGSRPDLRQRVTAVTRDVVVNVLANLIAGAVVYLAGVGTDVFKPNERLEHIAWVAVILGAVAATLLLALAKPQERVTYLIIAASLLGPAAILVALYFDFPPMLRIITAITGALVMVAGWQLLRRG
jgi:hypothetical protein